MARLGDYELIDRFAVGGVAEIYRARDVKTGALVVVKRLRPDLEFDPEKHAGFLRELQLAMLCAHKNLIRGIAKGTQNGTDYGVLELVDGPDLQQILKRAKTLEPRLAVYVVVEILSGLEFAFNIRDAGGHPLGLVHRDLSPKNVFVTYGGEVRVGDFGSSLATYQEDAQAVVGTLGYMSPEQASMQPLDGRSDLYAAGLILFELLTGQMAFDVNGKKDALLLKQHQQGKIRAVPHDVPEDLKMIIEIATSQVADDRYESVREMRKALMRTDDAPTTETPRALGDMLQTLFRDEYAKSRM
jgi:serine/threonine protein kinase